MAPRKKNNVSNVPEDFKIKIETILHEFVQDSTVNVYEFPDSLTNVERCFVHNYVKHKYRLKTRSHGKEPNRRLFVTKPKLDIGNIKNYPLCFDRGIYYIIYKFLQNQEFQNCQDDPFMEPKPIDTSENKLGIGYGIPQLPQFSINIELINLRTQLPIWFKRDQVMEEIISNQVLIVCGETGSGKSTQIPQFILDYSASCGEKCRIVCTQPRRISAISIAERVAVERNEQTGQTVGYNIRLESCVSPKTSLIYCTNGILLRTLMSGDSCLNNFTHIIVDEIHERDRFSDFLLICLRECLINYPKLRLILMSATMDIQKFKNYFNQPKVMFVEGRKYPVTDYYLEDILMLLNYETPAMFKIRRQNACLNIKPTVSNSVAVADVAISDELRADYLLVLKDCITTGLEESFNTLIQIVLSENAPVDLQDPDTGCTALIAATYHGRFEAVVDLMRFGANPYIEGHNGLNAIGTASVRNFYECEQMLKMHGMEKNLPSLNQQYSEEVLKENLDVYMRSISDDAIDFELLHALIFHIYMKPDKGGILVFLSGYEDIVTVKDFIISDTRFDSRKYVLIMLHSLMHIADQNNVFTKNISKRKIVLATNIAETSITIEDIKYVIDTGKVKEKCFDAINGIGSLHCNWISKASATQRSGRAGRTQPGECFRLFSKNRYQSMEIYTTPEILRMPLYELCLQTKKLAPRNMKIVEFLSRAMDPPSTTAVIQAIEHLKEIDALDDEENLTALGNHLVDLPVEPRLAKMLIYSVIFRCVDPMLTIVAFLSQRDPFLLSAKSHEKIYVLDIRKSFSQGSYSDHLIFLKAFQDWQEARLQRNEKVFCKDNFISPAVMEMVIAIRSQLLAQLRASGFVKTKPPGDIRDLNENSNNWPMIKAVLTAGLFPQIAIIDRALLQVCRKKEGKLLININSALRKNENDQRASLESIPTDWLIYEELSGNTTYHIRTVTCVTTLTIALFSDNCSFATIVSNQESQTEDSIHKMILLSGWIGLEEKKPVLELIQNLRMHLEKVIFKKISNPYRHFTQQDEALIKLTAIILKQEDIHCGLFQPDGIGNRPKIMSSSNDTTRQNRQLLLQNKTLDRNSIPVEFKFLPINKEYKKYESEFLLQEKVMQKRNRSIQSGLITRADQKTIATRASRSDWNQNTSNFPPSSFYSQQQKSYEKFRCANPINQSQHYGPNEFDPNASSSKFSVNSQDNSVENYYAPNPTTNIVPFDQLQYQNPADITPLFSSLNMQQPSTSSANNQPNMSDGWNSNYSTNFEISPTPVVGAMYGNGSEAAALPIQVPNYPTFHNLPYPQARNLDANKSYFIIRTSLKSIEISINKKTWVFSPQVERKLIQTFQTGQIMILFFMVPITKCFHGVARLHSITRNDPTLQSLTDFAVEWISRYDIPFNQLQGEWDNVQDGEEINPKIGEHLLEKFLNCDPKVPVQVSPINLRLQNGRPIRKTEFN